MRRRYMDEMALVREYGKPDMFLTMTCNSNWDEICAELLDGQSPSDRPDLVARLFKAKLEAMKELLFKKHFFGQATISLVKLDYYF
jgi:Helitron helicase-like domain at N-terminus